jgi:hypothetical protein
MINIIINTKKILSYCPLFNNSKRNVKNLVQRKSTWSCLSLFSHHQSSLCFSNSNDLINFLIFGLNLIEIGWVWLNWKLQLNFTTCDWNSIHFGFNWKNWWIQIWNRIQFNLVESISIWLNWIECYWIEFCGLNQFLESLENIHIKWWIFL